MRILCRDAEWLVTRVDSASESELLLTEQHPVLQWLAERLMMLMKRDEAP